jgi:hypothetical protein
MTDWTTVFAAGADQGIEDALADLERERRKLREVAAIWDGPGTTVRAAGNAFSMTFDGRGEPTKLTFNAARYRSLPPAQLAQQILDVLRQGRAEAMRKVRDVAGPDTRSGMSFEDLAQGKVDPLKVLDSLVGPMFEVLGGVGAPEPAKEAGQDD